MTYKSIFSMHPGKSRSIFLPEVPVEGLTAADVDPLKEKVFRLMEAELIKRKAKWIEGNVSPTENVG
jgi:1-acyl-sn-glycerol-3-phosphate acyltransferase